MGRWLMRMALSKYPPRGMQRILRLWDLVFGPSVLLSPRGVKLRVYLSSLQDRAFFRHPSNPTLERLIGELHVGDTFLDVGANIGYYSLLASHRIGAEGVCYAFEPSPREAARLLENLVLNHCNNVVMVSCAASDRQGAALINVTREHTGLNHLRGVVQADDRGGTPCKCAMTRVDAVVPVGNRIALAKVDAEGSELEALRGMSCLLQKGLVGALMVEVTEALLVRYGHTKKDLYSFMAGYGYRGGVPKTDWQYDEVFRM